MAGFSVATVGMFVVAPTIPKSTSVPENGLPRTTVLVVAYQFVRIVRFVEYGSAAGADTRSRRQIAVFWLPLIVMNALPVIDAVQSGIAQSILFAIAVLGEWLSIYLTTRHDS